MARLINADELIKYIKIWEIGTSISSDQKEFIDCISRQPTAFDVDEVIEQMEQRIANFDCKSCRYENAECEVCDKDCSDALIDDLLDIVKGGGAE